MPTHATRQRVSTLGLLPSRQCAGSVSATFFAASEAVFFFANCLFSCALIPQLDARAFLAASAVRKEIRKQASARRKAAHTGAEKKTV